jgi:hypothetical protein
MPDNTKEITSDPNTKVVMTFNCDKCDQLYWAFLPNELAWWNTMSQFDQDKFMRKHYNEHLKVCYVSRRN